MPTSALWTGFFRRLPGCFLQRWSKSWESFLSWSKEKEVHLHGVKCTDQKIGPEDVENLVEGIENGFIVYLFELEVGHFCSGCLRAAILIHLLVELLKELLGNHRLQPINDSVFVFFRTKFFSVALQQPKSAFHVVAAGHVDQSQKIKSVVNWIGSQVQM